MGRHRQRRQQLIMDAVGDYAAATVAQAAAGAHAHAAVAVPGVIPIGDADTAAAADTVSGVSVVERVMSVAGVVSSAAAATEVGAAEGLPLLGVSQLALLRETGNLLRVLPAADGSSGVEERHRRRR